MKSDNVLLSIIIPTYKRNDNLVRAINSIIKEKGSYEIIVVDDNDQGTIYRKTNEVLMGNFLKNYSNIKYIKHSHNMNGAAARNTGINNSNGLYITFLDDDDEFCNDRIAELSKIIKEGYDMIYTGFSHYINGKKINDYFFDISNKKISSIQYDLLCQKSFFGTGSNIVLKRELVEKINGFDESFERHQDIEFLIRYLEVCKTINFINKILVIKNLDDNSNLPNFNKMYNTKIKFISKFEYLINEYSSEKKYNILKINFMQLYQVSCKNSSLKDQNSCIDLMKKNGVYCFRDVVKIKVMELIKKSKIIKKIRPLIGR